MEWRTRLSPLWCHCLASVVCLLASKLTSAEVVDIKVSNITYIQSLHRFWVYSREKAPHAFQDATVNFSGLIMGSLNGGAPEPMHEYIGVELGLVRASDFDNENVIPMCCRSPKLTGDKEACGAQLPNTMVWLRNDDGLPSGDVTVRLPTQGHGEVMTLNESGAYVLTLSNCGEKKLEDPDTVVRGRVEVKNPFGYMPAIHYRKLPLYGTLAVAYMVLLCFWAVFCLIYYKELLRIQSCILAVLLIALVEASLWFLYYKKWNDTGREAKTLFYVAILVSVGRAIFSYVLVLVCSMGWGITSPRLERSVIKWIVCLCVVFVPLDFARRLLMSFQNSSMNSPEEFNVGIFFCVLVPSSVLSGITFYWVFSSLGTSIDTLTAQKQTEKLKLFQQLWCLLVSALILLTLSQLVEMVTMGLGLEMMWYAWLIEDTVGNLLYVWVLFCLMILWRPRTESKRYAYSQQVSLDEEEPADDPGFDADPFTLGDDDDDDDDDDIQRFDDGESPDAHPVPTTVGASSFQ